MLLRLTLAYLNLQWHSSKSQKSTSRLDHGMALSITLDPTETGPLFLQIAARVRTAIARGQMSPGGRLPSSRALAAQLAVARGTVDAAYAMLAGEGAIVAHGSAGTIVAGLPGLPGRRGQVPEQSPFAFPPA